MLLSSPLLLIAGAIFLLAGAVKGLIGLGLPTVSIALLALLMSPAEAAALLVIPSLITNIWQMAGGPSLAALFRRLWSMLLGICVGTMATAGILTGSNTAAASAGLGAALLVYGVLALSGYRPKLPPHLEVWLSPLAGIATGLVTGATGVFVIPAVPYLQSIGLEKDELVQALGLSFTVSTLALTAALVQQDAFALSQASLSLLALAPALLGMLAGQWIRVRMSVGSFRICLYLGLMALGIHLLLNAA